MAMKSVAKIVFAIAASMVHITEERRMKNILFILVLLIVHSGFSSAGYSNAGELKEDEAERICASYRKYSPGPNAVPAAEDRRRFGNSKVCGGFIEESIGNLRELDEMRRCCLASGGCNRELAMIFANGWGTRHDYDAALYFLCRAEDEMASAEQWGMIGHIREMMKDRKPQDLFYCDYVTSGQGQLYCVQIEAGRKDAARTSKIEALGKALDGKSREKLKALAAAAEKFAEAEAGLHEVADTGSTGYPALVLLEQGKVHDFAISEILRLAARRAPAATEETLKKADTDLNRAYNEALSNPPECDLCSDPQEGVKNLREAQRVWIKYRDAWVFFYQSRWKGSGTPDALKREIMTELTTERTKQLRKTREDAIASQE